MALPARTLPEHCKASRTDSQFMEIVILKKKQNTLKRKSWGESFDRAEQFMALPARTSPEHYKVTQADSQFMEVVILKKL